MRKAVRVSVLILALACSARAGYMPNGTAEPPPPPPPTISVQVTEIALDVLENLLSLF